MDHSKTDHFSGSPQFKKCETQINRSDSSVPSFVSLKSDKSMTLEITFKEKRESTPGDGVLMQAREKTNRKNIITDAGCISVTTESYLHGACKTNLIMKLQHMNEVITEHGNPALFNEIYTELCITEGESEKVNREHEVRQIEEAFRRTAREERPINCNDIFKPLSEKGKSIRSVLTKGVAGIGKTISVQKFILDWAEGKTNQDVNFIFPFPFRELNLMKDQKLCLMELLHFFFQENQETNISSLGKILFIFDGLDECCFPMDFQNTVQICDVNESASVHVLLINLIKGNLLPSALIWITSRPAAADQIPSDCVDRITVVQGFNDPEKEEYFKKRISDLSLSNRIIAHLKSLKSLYIMCHIPVFCWILATVLERMLVKAECGEIPKTLTQMYTHFLIIQTNIIKKKYKMSSEADMVLKLSKLAFKQLIKGNMIFYEKDLMESGIDVKEASLYSGVCTQIFREEFGLHQCRAYCFVHLSIQEHLAALYVHLTFMNEKRNILQGLLSKMLTLLKQVRISDVHKCAVDQALQSKNGSLDLFLRFLLGFSVESNQSLLQTILRQTGSSSHSTQETVHYIKKKIRENPLTEKSINLFHCLHELDDDSLVKEVQHHLQSGQFQQRELSPSQWSAVVFVLLTSIQENDFVLNKYTNKHCTSDEVLLKLLPVVSASRRAEFIHCDLNERSYALLASVLSSESTSLRELDMSRNVVRDSKVKCLSAGLGNPHCKLETLRLCACAISFEGCAALSSALRSNPSYLKVLDLSENKLRDTGLKCFCTVVKRPACKLKTLRLRDCGISDDGCADLTLALISNPLHLRELDLTGNKFKDSGLKWLFAVLKKPDCKLETLSLCGCGISDEGCAALASALRSNPSHLKELDVSWNKLKDSGMEYLSSVLWNPHCKLETLKLRNCAISDEGIAVLTSVLSSNHSCLRELDLSRNQLRDAGVKCLAVGLKNPHCKLETLRLCDCHISDEGCAALTSALKSKTSHLRELDLTGNDLRDSKYKLLFNLKLKDLSSVFGCEEFSADEDCRED
ncbi:NACHT, LRR and PYD domains-containing protein 12-like isoform X3 [Silurus meridionalis]|uniref:NACHT domain-containing protein n=2 Tax=Silurus meridionalis TaxID=175797 RepID=A0A8T0BG61_SILME|nr:NACHT, LRR and PYD domains-containing protein 12-like isoform X3 [Silurus meridionalis]XP_046706857.1 NACHT, LRR and PYD domains-containing protein 12-like isoform X3 [Silurus meridionalis]XP_046706858.1 NACHT, LRR and PYD domains-containing protein 12-like isoform X3 [Silurus meridionalis]KAF7706058.1 hypothetical protein HF521_019312 [Silurus meridionalis]